MPRPPSRRSAHPLRFAARRLGRFARCSGGATAIEYGLIVGVLSLVVIAAVTATGQGLYNTMNNVSARIAAGR